MKALKIILFSFLCLLLSGFTADSVKFEQHPNFIRIVVYYTINELQQQRKAQIDFKKVSSAQIVYWNLLKGAHFYLGDHNKIHFKNNITSSKPW